MSDTMIRRSGFRNIYLWLVIGIPLAAVAFSLQFVWIAFTNQDALVKDDWYQDGKTVNQSFARDDRAAVMGLVADIRFDDLTGEVLLTLRSRAPVQAPTLTLNFVHATREQQDQKLVLQRLMGNEYRGQLATPLAGTFQIELDGGDWRLTGSRQLPANGPLSLSAQ